MRVFFDLDGTLNKITNSLLDENGSVQLEKMYKTKKFFEHIEPEKNMLELVNELSERGVDVYALSACELGDPPGFEKQKDNWLDKHGVNIKPENRIYVPYGKDKTDHIPGGLQDGDILIDDYNINLKEWQDKANELNVNAKAVKAVNSLNDKGLGALGGDRGNIWTGERIYTSFPVWISTDTILNIFSDKKPEEVNLNVEYKSKKVEYNAYYYLDGITFNALANIEVQSGERALFSVLMPPNSEQTYLVCDNYDTDGYTLSNTKNPNFLKDRQKAINEFVYRQAIEPSGSDDCLLMFKEDELNNAVQHIHNTFPDLRDRLSQMVRHMATPHRTEKEPVYKFGLDKLYVKKAAGSNTYDIYGIRNGENKYLFSSDAPTTPFFVNQINGTIGVTQYHTQKNKDTNNKPDIPSDSGEQKIHR